MGKIILFPIMIVAAERVVAGACAIEMKEIFQSIDHRKITILIGVWVQRVMSTTVRPVSCLGWLLSENIIRADR